MGESHLGQVTAPDWQPLTEQPGKYLKPMGIRYYAYAFDGDLTEQVLADPRSALPEDPLADAWGFEPGARPGYVTGEQRVPERDMLYLDKAWRHLQHVAAPGETDTEARPAYRMFEGEVVMNGPGWEPWIRVLTPPELPAIARDLGGITESDTERRLRRIRYFGEASMTRSGMRWSTCGQHRPLPQAWRPRVAGWST